MSQIKKLWGILFAFILLMTSAMPVNVCATGTSLPKRVINVVYDESGSMIQMSGKKFDTWCQAKYSMEVFASMLGENDTMNVYVMSDYMTGSSAGPKLSLAGENGAEVNVKKVHDMITRAQDTPFTSVKKAYSDLTNVKADEKWLVVLTDGEFDEYLDDSDGGKSAINKFFSAKKDDIKVMFFGMGSNAAEITQKAEDNIFYEKAKNNDEILNKITEICTRIFNSHKLEINTTDKKVSFDVPMSQLIVFAQGAKVKIKSLKSDAGEEIKASNVVSVRYSEKAATNPSYQDPKIAKNLMGKVATFNGDFDAGEYVIDASGAETIEVYYKPNVAIAAYLKNEDGEEVTNIEELETGEYIIEFGFIREGTNEIVQESKLLGDVKYSAIVTNNGKQHDKTYSSGDKIKLEEGELIIDAVASFLDYNTVSTSLNYTIYKNKGITFTIQEEPDYEITSKGINKKPIIVKITLDGEEFTKEQWKSLETPSVELGEKLPEEDAGFLGYLSFIRKINTIDDVKVVKTEEPGVLELYPSLKKDKVKGGTYVGSKYNLSVYSQSGKAVWKGDMDGKVELVDKRGLLERELATVIRLAIAGGFIFILLGYTPLFKKRLPKSMRGCPTIECKPLPFGKVDTALGRFSKDSVSVWLPYLPEKGMLTFVPSGTPGVPAMKLKAAGGSKMIIENTASFAGNKIVSIDGETVPEEQKKPLSKTPSMTIEVKTPLMRYTCTPRF